MLRQSPFFEQPHKKVGSFAGRSYHVLHGTAKRLSDGPGCLRRSRARNGLIGVHELGPRLGAASHVGPPFGAAVDLISLSNYNDIRMEKKSHASRVFGLILAAAACLSCSAIVDNMLEGKDGSVDDPVDDRADTTDAEVVCPLPLTSCGGVCTDTAIDRENCGECGVVCVVPSYCRNGHCVCPDEPAGLLECDGECVNTDTDSQNCGGCGTVCAADELCDGTGRCASECSEGYEMCGSGSTRHCADLSTDTASCGECDRHCPIYPHAVPVCDGGSCTFACDPGWSDPNVSTDDGCECLIFEEYCDGKDNDCDGLADEEFECLMNQTEPCTLDGTTCTGTRQCSDACAWESCTNPAWQCTPDGTSQTCTLHGSCTGNRTCQDDCTWSACNNPDWTCSDPGLTEACNLTDSLCSGSRTCLACVWGACAASCAGSTPDCCPSTGCVNTDTDSRNCGTCGNACDPGGSCSVGRCHYPDVIDHPDIPDLPDWDAEPDWEVDFDVEIEPDWEVAFELEAESEREEELEEEMEFEPDIEPDWGLDPDMESETEGGDDVVTSP
jgi:hypothetical protein